MKWEPIPNDEGIISAVNERGRPYKCIGEFSHRSLKNGVLTGLKVDNGPEIKITKDEIFVEGYEKSWVSVTYMDNNNKRWNCAMWVWQLICEGTFESHRKLS